MIEHIASEIVHLLPERALYWPGQRMLVVADIHFGKAASFRALGVPVPRGTTAQNLAVLDRLLVRYAIEQIIFLGDFLHAANARAAGTLATIETWRGRYPALSLLLVRGNHDVHAGDPPPTLRIDSVDAPYYVDPFAFCHHPAALPGSYVMAGHVHPIIWLSSRVDRVRLPCFLVGPQRMILPSFGAFTGGFAVTPMPDEQVYAVTDDRVIAIRAPLRTGRL